MWTMSGIRRTDRPGRDRNFMAALATFRSWVRFRSGDDVTELTAASLERDPGGAPMSEHSTPMEIAARSLPVEGRDRARFLLSRRARDVVVMDDFIYAEPQV
jgi:hypothetical protein